MNKEEDWSPDTIIGRMRKERIVTVVERKSRYVRMERRHGD
jgi:IS30 family transposase